MRAARSLHYLILTVFVSFTFHAVADEKVVWNKTPINIVLKPNQERIITFPFKRVQPGLPSQLVSKLSTLSNNGVLYWQASEPFTSQQILVKDKDTQQIIIINLSADDKTGSSDPISILLGESLLAKETNTGEQSTASQEAIQYGYDELTRVASKHLYAPARLITLPAGMHRINVKAGTDSHLIRHHNIMAEPAISFSNNGLYVTAVNLVNQEPESVVLDPRDIRGKWLAATFQHVVLGEAGSITDTTTVYLISKRPFWESL